MSSMHPVTSEADHLAWWTHARFGMFIHWGLFSAAGGTWKGKPSPFLGCWMQERFRLPVAEYAAALLPKFTGERFDPDAIAELAAATGMKYVVAIAKHHEGFALFDSAVSDFTIMNTPARRDWIGALAEAVHKRGLKLGIYYSQNLDWHHPGGGGDTWDQAQHGDADAYVDGLVIPQLRELLSNYGEVSVLWFDIPGGAIDAARAERIVSVVRTLQPKIIINNRLGGGARGDFQTPEQHIPPAGMPGLHWEVCQTLNDTWEYTHYDRNWKTSTQLIRELIDTASKGGNYLLNIGPKPDGSVPVATQDLLSAVGRWMQEHAEAIHGTQASPFTSALPWGRCTQKRLPGGITRLYFHIFRWPFDAELCLPALDNRILQVSLLSGHGGHLIEFQQPADHELRIRLPIAEPNDHATVVMVDIEGEPKVLPRCIKPDGSGVLILPAAWAEVCRGSVTPEINGYTEAAVGQLSYFPDTDCLGIWRSCDDIAAWWIAGNLCGDYLLEVIYSNYAPTPVSVSLVVEAKGRRMEMSVGSTAGQNEFRTDTLGHISLPPGERICLKLFLRESVEAPALMVKALQLKPLMKEPPRE